MKKRPFISKQLVMAFLFVIFLSLPVAAQTFGDIALSQSILSGTRKITGKSANKRNNSYRKPSPKNGVRRLKPAANKKVTTTRKSVQLPKQPDMQAKWKLVEPEHKRRVRVYGRSSADRWLAEKGREMGRRDGSLARKP